MIFFRHFLRDLYVHRRKNLRGENLLVNSSDLIFSEDSYLKESRGSFVMAVVLGHQDYSVQNETWIDGKTVHQSKAHCLLMIKCARTLVRKTPAPDDPAAVLRSFRTEKTRGEEQTTEIHLAPETTDATVSFLLKHYPKVQVLDLYPGYLAAA